MWRAPDVVPALTTTEPLSFWGGVDAETGEIIDRSPSALWPPSGRESAGPARTAGDRVPGAGSFWSRSATSTAPAAILTTRIDPIIALGSILGDELYGTPVPVVVISADAFDEIRDGDDLDNGTRWQRTPRPCSL